MSVANISLSLLSPKPARHVKLPSPVKRWGRAHLANVSACLPGAPKGTRFLSEEPGSVVWREAILQPNMFTICTLKDQIAARSGAAPVDLNAPPPQQAVPEERASEKVCATGRDVYHSGRERDRGPK